MKKLPPHGYEGRRAEPRPVPAPKLPPTTAADLDLRGVTFASVGGTPGELPVRLFLHGHCCGVFPTPRAANSTLRLLAGSSR